MENPQNRPGYELIDSWSRGREPRVDWNSRDSIIRWLIWNDPNGDYTDDETAVQGYPPLTLDQARELMIGQISEA